MDFQPEGNEGVMVLRLEGKDNDSTLFLVCPDIYFYDQLYFFALKYIGVFLLIVKIYYLHIL